MNGAEWPVISYSRSTPSAPSTSSPSMNPRLSRFGPAYTSWPCASRNTQPSRWLVFATPSTSPGATPQRSSAVRVQRARMPQNASASKEYSFTIGTSGLARTLYVQGSPAAPSRRPSVSKTLHLAPPVPASSATIAARAAISPIQNRGVGDVLRPLPAQPHFDAVDDQVGLMLYDVARGAAEMRRHQHVGQLDVAVLRPDGLVGKHVERRAGEMAVTQRAVERLVIDDRRPRQVQQVRAALHRADAIGADQAVVFRRVRTVQGEHVDAAYQRVEIGWVGPRGMHRVGGHERIVDQHAAAEGAQALDDAPADGPEAHDTDGHATELEAAVSPVDLEVVAGRIEGHLARLEQPVDRINVAGEREHEAERQVGDRIRVAPRRKQHRDAELGRARHADVDGIAAAAPDQAQRVGVEHVLVDEVGFDDEHVGAHRRDALVELRGVEIDPAALAPVLVHDGHVPLQTAHAVGCEGRGDESFHAGFRARSARISIWTRLITWGRKRSRSSGLRTLAPRRLWNCWLSSMKRRSTEWTVSMKMGASIWSTLLKS